ncbi:hypothetical protein B0H13DRAFT_2318061 [Mycena leptocephala]|nr:hypothetical protein B0H13DRAFT_2318061 [Mycena leptocephala]
MHADLCDQVPFVFDYFGDPDDDPLAEDRFTVVPTQEGWLVCDAHTDDDHEILRSQLLDPDFDFIMFLYNEKWKIEDQLHTENHPIRVRKREDRKREEDEKFANLPPMTPLSRCESPELRTGDDRRIDLPHTFRMFLWRLGCDPDELGTAEEVIEGLITDFMNLVPYSFDPRGRIHREGIFSPDRFTLDYSERDFMLLTDQFHGRGYELPYSAILWQRWDPKTQEADTEDWTDDELGTETSWSNCGFTSSDDDIPPPPPPPPAGGASSTEAQQDDESELGEPPDLDTVSNSDSDSDSDSDSMPGLDTVSESDWNSDSDSEDYDVRNNMPTNPESSGDSDSDESGYDSSESSSDSDSEPD